MPSMAQAKDLLVGTRVLICCITMNVLTEHPSYAILYSTIGASMAFLASRTKPASFRHLPIRFTVQGLGVLISTIGVSLHLSSLHLQPFPSHPTVHRGCVLIAGVTFAYAGHVSFSDTFLKSRDSADLPRTLASVQTCEVIMYKVSAITTHFFVGDDISSPAFISVGRLFRHISIACGVPVPITIIRGVAAAHFAVKFILALVLCGSTSKHRGYLASQEIWQVVFVEIWILSYIFSDEVAVYKYLNMLKLGFFSTGGLFSSLPRLFGLYVNRYRSFLTQKQMIAFSGNLILLVVTLVICVTGTVCCVWSVYQHLCEDGGSCYVNHVSYGNTCT